MNPLLESMTPLTVCGYAVRVWREEVLTPFSGSTFDVTDLVDLADDMSQEFMSGTSTMAIARKFIEMPRVNAVEVLNEDRKGLVLYSSKNKLNIYETRPNDPS